MGARPLSHLRPSPAMIIALIALLFATTGGAFAVERINKDEVNVITLSGGPVTTTSAGADVTIPLNGANQVTFTQKAGQAIQIVATWALDAGDQDPGQPGASFCNLFVIVADPNGGIAARPQFDFKSEAGEIGDGSAVGGKAAPAVDTPITLKAIAREINTPDAECDQPNAEEGGDQDTWTVSVRVSVITLRN